MELRPEEIRELVAPSLSRHFCNVTEMRKGNFLGGSHEFGSISSSGIEGLKICNFQTTFRLAKSRE